MFSSFIGQWNCLVQRLSMDLLWAMHHHELWSLKVRFGEQQWCSHNFKLKQGIAMFTHNQVSRRPCFSRLHQAFWHTPHVPWTQWSARWASKWLKLHNNCKLEVSGGLSSTYVFCIFTLRGGGLCSSLPFSELWNSEHRGGDCRVMFGHCRGQVGHTWT